MESTVPKKEINTPKVIRNHICKKSSKSVLKKVKKKSKNSSDVKNLKQNQTQNEMDIKRGCFSLDSSGKKSIRNNENEDLDLRNMTINEFLGSVDLISKKIAQQKQPQLAYHILQLADLYFNTKLEFEDVTSKLTEIVQKFIDTNKNDQNLNGQSQNLIVMLNKIREILDKAWINFNSPKSKELQAYMNRILNKNDFSDANNLATNKEYEKMFEKWKNLNDYNNELLHEQSKLNIEIEELKKRFDVQHSYIKNIEEAYEKAEKSNQKYVKGIEHLQNEKQELENKVKNIECQASNNEIQRFQEHIEKLEKEVKQLNANLIEKDQKLKAVNQSLEDLSQSFTSQSETIRRLNRAANDIKIEKTNLNSQLNDLKLQIEERDEKISSLIQEIKAKDEANNELSKKWETSMELNVTLNEENYSLKNKLELSKNQLDTEIKKNEELIKTQNNLKADFENLKNIKENLENKIKAKDILINNQNIEMQRYLNSIEKEKKMIDEIEAQQDNYLMEIEMLNEQIETLNATIQLKTDEISRLKEFLDVKNEYTCHAKQFNNTHNLASYANGCSNKCNKEKYEMQKEISKLRHYIKKMEKTLDDYKYENESLFTQIREYEDELMELQNNIDEIREEKCDFEMQIIRKNDEAKVLREKINEIQEALDWSISKSNQKHEEIRKLKQELSELRSQYHALSKKLMNPESMRKNKMTSNQSSLTESDQTKRWKVNKENSPERFEILQKMDNLQRKFSNIRTRTMTQPKSRSQKSFLKLQSFAAKLPNSKVREDLLKSHTLNVKLQKKLKALIGELNAKEAEIQQKNYVIAKFQDSISIKSFSQDEN